MDDLDVDIKRTIDNQVDATELLPFRYKNLIEVELPLGQFAPSAEVRREGSNMTVLQLILLGTHLLVAVIFYTDGKRTGYIEGRKAVRKHYEKLEQQFKVSR